jgi:cobyrinic acid a,c-diamide synthase
MQFWDLPENQKTDGQQEKEVPDADLKIGVAMDKAFCFYYADMFDEFRRNGAEVIFFSPMAGELRMLMACILGGYPELYPCELQDSATTKALKDLSADGMPIYGECGDCSTYPHLMK